MDDRSWRRGKSGLLDLFGCSSRPLTILIVLRPWMIIKIHGFLASPPIVLNVDSLSFPISLTHTHSLSLSLNPLSTDPLVDNFLL